MSFVTVKFPLYKSGENVGFDLIKEKDLSRVIKFNLKNILLTNPGEKPWDIDFGVGLQQALFEPSTPGLSAKIDERIRDQIELYAPYLALKDLSVFFTEDGVASVRLEYKILLNNTSDNMDLQITL